MIDPLVVHGILNNRIKVKIAFEVGFIPITDPDIDEEKRAVYRLFVERGLFNKVPYIKLIDIHFDPDQNSNIIKHLSDQANFPPFYGLSRERNKIGIYTERFNVSLRRDEVQCVTEHGYLWDMIYNSKYDDMFNFLFAMYCGDVNLSEALFVSSRKDLREDLIADTGSSIKKFIEYANGIQDYIRDFVKSSGSKIIEIGLKSWAPYMKKILYSDPGSKFYGILPIGEEGGGGGYKMNQFEFLVLDVDDKTRDWKSIFAAYKRENPETRLTGISLPGPPVEYQLMDRRYLNFVAYDNENNKMVGYITCSLRTATTIIKYTPSDETEPYFNVEELNRLNGRLIERGGDGKYDGIGYDIFAIDGIHIHQNYRSTVLKPGVTLSKVMIFCALEFIRISHKELGVTMVMAYSLAIQTKQILVGTFGFNHYNKIQDFSWIHGAFDEYLISMSPDEGTLVLDTLPRFLSFSETIKSLKKFQESYFPFQSKPGVAYKNIITQIQSIISNIEGIIRNYEVYDVVKGRSKLPSSKSKGREIDWKILKDINLEFSQLVTYMTKYMSKNEKLLSERMKKFIGEGNDTDDTLLTLSEKFYQTMNTFYTQMTSAPVASSHSIMEIPKVSERFENINILPVVYKKDPIQEKLIVMKEKQQSDPTEEDMAIYQIVENLSRQQSNVIVIDSSESNDIPMEEEEEEERNVEIHRLEEYIKEMEERLARGLRKIRGREKEIFNFYRELIMIERNEMNFGKLLLTQ